MTFLVRWDRATPCKECHICIFKPDLEFLTFGAYRLLHSPIYKSSRCPQSLLGQLNTGCKTTFHYLKFALKYDHLCHASMSSVIWLWSEIGRPMWQEMLLRTPDCLRMCGGPGHEIRTENRLPPDCEEVFMLFSPHASSSTLAPNICNAQWTRASYI